MFHYSHTFSLPFHSFICDWNYEFQVIVFVWKFWGLAPHQNTVRHRDVINPKVLLKRTSFQVSPYCNYTVRSLRYMRLNALIFCKNRNSKTHCQRWKQTTWTVIVCERRKQDVGIFHSTLVGHVYRTSREHLHPDMWLAYVPKGKKGSTWLDALCTSLTPWTSSMKTKTNLRVKRVREKLRPQSIKIKLGSKLHLIVNVNLSVWSFQRIISTVGESYSSY